MNIPFPLMSVTGTHDVGVASTQKGQEKGLIALMRGTKADASGEDKAFVDFVMARVAALQMSKEELAELKTKSADGREFFSKEEGILVSLLESGALNSTDSLVSFNPENMPQLSTDALIAVRQMAATIVQAHEEGTITLSDSILKAFQSLAELNIDQMQEQVPADLATGQSKDETESTANAEHNTATASSETRKTDISIPSSLVSALEKLGLVEDVLGKKTALASDTSTLMISEEEFKALMVRLQEKIKNLDSNSPETKSIVAALNVFISDLKKISQDIAKKDALPDSDIAKILNEIAPGGDSETPVQESVSEGVPETTTESTETDSPSAAPFSGDVAKQPNSKSGTSGEALASGFTNPDPHVTALAKQAAAKNDALNINNGQASGKDSMTPEYEWRASQQPGNASQSPASLARTAGGDSSLPFGQLVRMHTPAGEKIATPLDGGLEGTDPDNELNFSLLKEAGQSKAAQQNQMGSSLRHGATTPPATQQVSVHIQKAIANGDSRINIKLHPEQLGRVDVKLEFTKDGHVRAVITADKPDTLSLLQKDAAQLQKALTDAGLETSSQDMSFHLREEQREAFANHTKNNGNHSSDTSSNNETGGGIDSIGDDAIHPDDIITPYRVDYRV